MLTNGIEVMKYVRASAGRAGLSVVFEDVNQPKHDGDTIYLPKITAATTIQELKQLMASTDHEVAHDRFSCFDLIKEKNLPPTNPLMFVWNLLEDSRINMIESKEYEGFRENWDECGAEVISDIFKKAKKDTKPISKLVTSLIHWESQISASSFPLVQLATSSFIPDKTITNVLNNYSDRLNHCHGILDKRKGSQSTFDLAYDILTELKTSMEEEFKLPTKPKPSSGDGKSDGTTEIASTKTDGEGKPIASEEYSIIEIELTQEDIDNYSVTIPEDKTGMSKTGINIKPFEERHDDWYLTDYNKFVVVNYPKTIGNRQYFHKEPDFIKIYKDRVEKHLISQENFAQQVRKLIQVRSRVQTQYGTKKGKLDQSRLSRICFNAPGFNERVFKTRIENKTLDAAITVLVDMSGSMGGDKVYNALASTKLVNEVCSTINIPLEILGFTDINERGKDSDPLMFVYKSFSDFKVSNDSLEEYFSMSSNYMEGNPDGENILWAYDRLLKRKEKKRILIVMSDGSPAASKGMRGISTFTHKVIEEIEKSKLVDIYGLGLCSDSVKDYYKSHSIVNEPQNIPSKLIELIERKILV
jgi:cobalamin biosynthesis protein CobT